MDVKFIFMQRDHYLKTVVLISILFDLALPQMTLVSLDSPNNIAECSNVEMASAIFNTTLTDCVSLCESYATCNSLNYLTHLKHISDSRCYLFNDTNHCILESISNGRYEEDQSFIFYKKSNETCVDYPESWKDSTHDNCAAYSRYNWCADGTPDLDSHSFGDFDFFRSETYGTSALQSCCDCDGGINYIDAVYWTSYYSEDEDITKDIICEPDRWLSAALDDYSAYQMCEKYNQRFLNSTLTQDIIMNDFTQDELIAPCDIFIDTKYESNYFDEYYLQICKQDGAGLNSLISFEVDWNEAQIYIFLNSDVFDLTSFESNRYYTNGSVCVHDSNITSYFGLMSCRMGPEPTEAPTASAAPTVSPVPTASGAPTVSPLPTASGAPTLSPASDAPTVSPVPAVSVDPTVSPVYSDSPTQHPTLSPVNQLTVGPTTGEPTATSAYGTTLSGRLNGTMDSTEMNAESNESGTKKAEEELSLPAIIGISVGGLCFCCSCGAAVYFFVIKK